MRRGTRRWAAWLPPALTALALAGCGLQIQEPDLFLIKRSGAGRTATIVINSDGTVTCNQRRTGTLSSSQLITARDIQPAIHRMALRKLRLPPTSRSIYLYRVRVDSGTITFPDTAAAHNKTLAQLELLDTQGQQLACGGS
jgi:hypothetical protein